MENLLCTSVKICSKIVLGTPPETIGIDDIRVCIRGGFCEKSTELENIQYFIEQNFSNKTINLDSDFVIFQTEKEKYFAITQYFVDVLQLVFSKQIDSVEISNQEFSFKRYNLIEFPFHNFGVFTENLGRCLERVEYLESPFMKIAFFYGPNNQTAERSDAIVQVNKVLFDLEGDQPPIRAVYIPVTATPEIDIAQITEAVRNGYKLFCSAVGSNDVQYLLDIYFSKVSEEAGIIHTNAFSTTIKLQNRKNLIRTFPPDSQVPPIFMNLSGDNPQIIIYITTSLWGSSLAEGLNRLAELQGVESILIPVSNPTDRSWLSIINALPPDPGNTHSLFIFSDFAIEFTDDIRTMTNIKEKFPFVIFYGDATAGKPVNSPENLVFINEHNGRVMAPFDTPNNVAYSELVNQLLQGTTKKTSKELWLYKAALDICETFWDETANSRRIQDRFVIMTLDKNRDNTDGFYQLSEFTGQNTTKMTNLILNYNNQQLFVTSPVPI